MIDRIVQLTFRQECVADFEALFEAKKRAIRSQPGCEGLRLLQDAHNPCVFFTYSTWQSEDNLNAYRYSDTFGEVWPKTKSMFSDKPRAWTVIRAVEVEL